MSNNTAFSKCDCPTCENHIEFPTEAAGAEIDCPHCGAKITLTIVDPVEESPTPVSAADIFQHFNGTITRARVSFFYQLGLGLVSVMMLLLPLIYIGLVCLAGWGVYLYATHFTFLLTSGSGGARLYIVKVMLYGGPLFMGFILVLFMIKPLFGRRPSHAQPLALNPASEPTVFAFIAKICDLVGAPMPQRIDLDCNLNASASFRRGMASLFSNDLVLTIGLPIVAGLNMQQLAGIVAHEFGHFTQGFGMRLSYVIRSINFWFARVVYERDAWDLWLEEMAEEAEDWRWMLLVGFTRAGVWFSRQILKLLMFIGHGVSSFLLRQMEYDADSYQMKLVGSQSFEETFRRMHVLGVLLKPAYNSLKVSLGSSRSLPEDFPALLLKQDATLTTGKRTQLEDTMGLETTGLFDTHPSNGDRIRCARQAEEPGIFLLQTPARELFQNFDIVSKQITQLHYSDDLGIPMMEVKLVPVKEKEAAPEPAQSALAQDVKAESSPLIPGRLRIRK